MEVEHFAIPIPTEEQLNNPVASVGLNTSVAEGGAGLQTFFSVASRTPVKVGCVGLRVFRVPGI